MLMSLPHIMLMLAIATTVSTAQPVSEVVPEFDPCFAGCGQYNPGSAEKKACSAALLASFINDHLVYPPQAIEQQIQGKVYVRFTIDTAGVISDPVVVRDIGYGCGEAALNVVRQMPPWEPGRTGGHPVRVSFTLPIHFSLEELGTAAAAGFVLSWGDLTQPTASRKAILDHLPVKVLVRDDSGRILPYSDLAFSLQRGGALEEYHSNGAITPRMERLVQKLRKGDRFTLTATVQKSGQFLQIHKQYRIE